MKARLLLPSLVVAVAVVLAVAAGSPSAASLACPTTNPPNELVLAGGSGQTAQLGASFLAPLEVQLANTNGCPLTGNVAGDNVTFDAPAGGASGIFATTGSREAVVGANGQGIATAPTFTANFTAGSYTVNAHSDVGAVELQLTNTAGGLAASIAATGGTPQEAAVGGPYPQPLQARVADANGNPVQGAVVTFAIVPGPTGAGASFLGAGPAAAATDSNGLATSPPLVANGSPGRFTAIASTDGVTAVAGYSLDNHAASSNLSAIGSTSESATVDSRYARPLGVRLFDAGGQPVEGATVTFTLGAAGAGGGGEAGAGASFVGGAGQTTTMLTDRNGEALTPAILANGTPGAFTATASVPGSAAQVTFALRNLAATLIAGRIVRTATVDHRYRRALTVRVRGTNGRPIAGIAVTFTIGKASNDAGAAFADGTSAATATTNRVGVAAAPPMTANGSAGTFTATATVTGSEPASFTLRNRPGRPTAVATGAADGSSTAPGTRLPIRLAVTVTDGNGNPVAGALVRFTAPRHGPGGHFSTAGGHSARTVRVRTNAAGIAIAPAFTANGIAGGYAVTVGAGAVRAAFALVNGR